mmetsp:Transcript_40223/g.159811  ORF Transcript_40223/g.159811 Transcript_40223/m.159811 type:complete len:217 (-) Transcript_40223:1347-1997(-)
MSSVFGRLRSLRSLPWRRIGRSSSSSPVADAASDTKIPAAPALLGYAGLIPFAAGAFGSYHDQYRYVAVDMERAYGAVILTFLGAVHWGLAIRVKGRMALPMYLFSVAPSMLGWLSTQLPILSAYPVLVLAFSAVHMMEARIFPRLQIPRWYSKLRLRLNVLAVIALMVTFSLSKNDPKLLEELKSEKDNPTTLMQLLTGNRKEPSDPSSTPKGPE